MARKKVEPSIYRVTYIGEKGQRQEKLIKATVILTTEVVDSVLVMFENRGTMVLSLPFHSFIQAELAEDKATLTEIK